MNLICAQVGAVYPVFLNLNFSQYFLASTDEDLDLMESGLGDNIGSNDPAKNPAFYDFNKGHLEHFVFSSINFYFSFFFSVCSILLERRVQWDQGLQPGYR